MKGPVFFEGKRGFYFYRIEDKRPPKRGEHYLSGAIPAAYLAPNDYPENATYYVVSPVSKAKGATRYD